MKVNISESNKKRIMLYLVTLVKDHNILGNGGYDIDVDKFIEIAKKKLSKKRVDIGDEVAVEILKRSETFDKKPCFFPFEVVSINQKRKTMRVRYLN